MRHNRFLAMVLRSAAAGGMLVVLLLCVPGTGVAQNAQTADLTLRLDIPEEIGIEVDGEFVFDLGRATGGKGEGPCVDRFPPPLGCAVAYYFPTSTTFRNTAVAAGLAPGTVALSFIDNLPSGVLHLRHSIASEWIGGDPGIPTTAIQSSSSQAASGGETQFGALPTTATDFLTVVAPHALTRADRVIRLAIPKDARVISTPAPVTTTITYEVVHGPS